MTDQEVLRADELAYLSQNKRCEHCEHLEALHWSTDEDAGCSLPECECHGMSVDISGYAPPDPNDPFPQIWSTELVKAAQFNSPLSRLVDRSFENDMGVGGVIDIGLTTITVTREEYGAMNPDGTWDVQSQRPGRTHQHG